MQLNAARLSFRVALIYIIAAGAWILFSDELVGRLISDPDTRVGLSILKGWGFVLLTGGCLYLLLKRSLQKWEQEAERRRQAELTGNEALRKLAQKEEQLRLVLEATADGVWDLNLQTGIADLSPRYWEITGYTPVEVVADLKFYERLVHPDDWPRVQATMTEHLAGNSDQSVVEYRMIPKDGAVKWIWGRGKVVERAADGKPLRMVGTVSDITDQKLAGQRAAEAMQYANTLLTASPIAIITYKAAGECVSANEAAAKLVGTTVGGLKNQNFRELESWKGSQLLEMAERALATGQAQVFDNEVVSSFGVNSWSACQFVPFHFEGELHLLLLGQDITERKQAEQIARESERFMQSTLDALSAHVAILDEQGAIIKVNAAWNHFARENGLKGDHHLGGNYLRVCDAAAGESSEGAMAVAAGIRKVMAGQCDAFELEYPCHSPQTQRWFIVRATRFADTGPVRVVVAHENISARKLAEAAVRDSEERYRQIFAVESDAILVVDRETLKFIDVNPAAEKMYGYSREEFLQLRATDVSADPAKTLGNIASGSTPSPQLRHRRKDGTVFPVEVSDSTFEYQGRMIKVGAMRDITERKLAEQKMRESEGRYRQLFEMESDALFLVDCKTDRLVEVNQSAQRLYGYSREELLQLTAEQVSAEPDQTRATLTTDSIFVPLRWHRKKNGQVFPVEISACAIQHQGRRMELTAIRDITERQRAMENLQEKTAQLLEAQHLASLGYYRFNAQTGTWTSSPELDGLFGIVDPTFVRDVTGWLDIVHPQDRAEMRRYVNEEVVKGHAPFDHVYRIIRLNDRQERWVHGLGKLVLDDAGKVVLMVGVIQDITERKQAELQTRLQFSALTAAANAIVITDHRGTIEWVNPSFTRLTGYAAEEVIGNNPRVLKSDQHPRAFYSTMWSTISTGNVWHGELVNKRKDGQLYHEDMTITPARGAEGQITHFVAIKQDVTERRQLEIRLQQAQKMEAIGTLAGGIAHDFNNILSAIFGNGYLLQQDTKGIPEAQENVAEVLKAATRAKELVQQILTFSHQRELSRQSIRLDTVIKEATKFLRASLPAEIRIDLQLAADAPAVLADPTQIYQVTLNLATNALHAMAGRPGRLTIALEAFQPDAPFLQAHPELQPLPHARLTVADTGQGMDARTLARIFEPFFTTKPVGQGTGLGLAVVHGIVQSHQGTITVASEVGRGTTFRLYFPAQTLAATVNEDAPRQLPHGLRQRILLLDDEPALTVTLQRLLERLQYHVTASNSAVEALALFRKSPGAFDLVITDLTMPEINGLEVARTLHTLRPELPVILVSGFAPDATPDRLRAAGIGELLIKPVSLPALAEALQRALTTA